MKIAVFHRSSPVDTAHGGALTAVLRHTIGLVGETKLTSPDSRIGRTRHWPASLLPVRFGGRIAGLWLRIGPRAWWFVVTHRRDVLAYKR